MSRVRKFSRKRAVFCDDDVAFHRHGDVAGKNQVRNRVEQNPVFRLQISRDERVGQLLRRQPREARDEGIRQFLEVGDFVDDLVFALLVAGAFGEQVAHFQHIFFSEKCFEYTDEDVMFLLHIGQVHDVVEEELLGAFGRDARNTLIGAVNDYLFEFTDFRVNVDAAVRVHKFLV